MTKIFFDTEFTGLHKKTTLISIGCVSECGKKFYAELTDYDKNQVDKWITENVISKLRFSDKIDEENDLYFWRNDDLQNFECIGLGWMVAIQLKNWLEQFEKVEMYSDCLAYDWVLFCNLFGSAFEIPKNVYYIPFDIATIFKLKNIDPDINREKFSEIDFLQYGELVPRHNALWDTKMIKICYEKLMQ